MAMKKTENAEITVKEATTAEMFVYVLGTSPYIYNAMSEKTWHELLLGGHKKNAAEKASTLKHEPYVEYRNSTYQSRDPSTPTFLNVPAVSFKKAIASAALDMPGASKAQVGRLIWAEGDRAPMYGVPKIFCAMVRSSDVARTPDVRTRAIIPQWCVPIKITYLTPNLNAQTLANLFGAAGLLNGVGDWRQQKGSGSYGQFRLAGADDPQVKLLLQIGGREAQERALANPEAYDEETERLLAWFDEEVSRRGHAAPQNGAVVTAKPSQKREVTA